MSSVTSLDEVNRSLVVPAVEFWNQKRLGSIDSMLLSSLVLFEAYAWIRIGVQADALPLDTSLEVIMKNRDALLDSLNIIERANLFGSELVLQTRSSVLGGTFPPSFRETYPNAFRQIPEVVTLFHLWYVECRNFIRSEHGSKFTEKLLSPTGWNSALVDLTREPFQPTGQGGSLMEGYLRSLQHLSRITSLFDHVGIEPEKRPALALMRVEVSAIHTWRLNLKEAFYHQRFLDATAIVESRLRSEAAAHGVELEHGGFIAGVEEVIKRYIRSLGFLAKTSFKA